MREKLIDIVEAYADFLDWDTKEEMVDSIMEFLATDNNVGHKWIPVTERLPEEPDRYLCNVKSFAFKGAYYQTILKYDKGGFIEGYIYTDDVTHWMPLPEPPKGE